MAYPDYDQLLSEIWGWAPETTEQLSVISVASNILVGTNPPYTTSDFFLWYPNFAGTPVAVQGTLDGSTGVVQDVSDFTGLATGQYVAGTGIANGTVILSMFPVINTLTLSQPTIASGVQTLSVYTNPPVPISIVNAFIYLASNSILQVRYMESWPYAMALYVAHYLTMWANSQGSGPSTTTGQLAGQGLAMGIAISKHVGDVSTASVPLRLPESFGTYALTSYGQQLSTLAMAVGSGPVWCW